MRRRSAGTAAGAPPGQMERSRARSSLDWRVIGPVAAAKVVFQLATATLYGAHRDEFYYLASGRHPAWGYVDNPPLIPMIYRAQEWLFGQSVAAMGVAPALLGGAYVLVAALLVREVGGTRFAQGLAAAIAALGPLYLTTSHFLSTVSMDLLFWAFASLAVLRLVSSGDRRWWLAIGGICGVGLLNKDTMAFWAAATVFGLAVAGPRRLLATWWLVAGTALAAALVAPNLLWEAHHHWATLEFLRHLRQDNASSDHLQFIPLQLGAVTLGGTVVWVIALKATITDPSWRPLRWLAAGYAFAFVVLFAVGGKSYYLGSWYLPVVAVGAAVIERSWTRRGRRVVLAAVVLTGLVSAPVFTPVLPPSTAVALGLDRANSDLGGMLGWPQVVDQVAQAYQALPGPDRQHAVILTDTYSEAGAIDFYGPTHGVPAAISGHNSFWLWGYGHPAPGAVVLAVGLSPDVVHTYWAHVTLVSVLGRGAAPIDPQERGAQIWICRGQRVAWSLIWPHLKHYD